MDDFIKYIEVHHIENNYWIVQVYPKELYQKYMMDQLDADQEIWPIDVFSALDEVTALSRTKRDYPSLVIGYTDGEVKDLPL